FPAPANADAVTPREPEHGCDAGVYRTTYYPSATIDKTVLLLGRGPELHISPGDRGLLHVDVGSFHDTLRAIGHGTIRGASGHVVRVRCDGGRAPQYIGSTYSALERLGVTDRYAFQAAVLSASVVLLLFGGALTAWQGASTRGAVRWLSASSAAGYLAFL